MRFAAVLLAAVALACASGCGGNIRADELSRSMDTLISSAGEGRLLAEGVAEDRTKTTFVRVRARELTEVTDHEAEKLNDASADPTLIAKKRSAVALAGQVSSALGELQTASTDRAAARHAERELASLAARAEALQRTL